MPGSQKFSQIFHRKVLSKFTNIRSLFRNFKRFRKWIWFSVVRLSELEHTKISFNCPHFQTARLWSDCRARSRMPPKDSLKLPKSIRFLLGNFKRFQKLICFLSRQISAYPITLSQYIFWVEWLTNILIFSLFLGC